MAAQGLVAPGLVLRGLTVEVAECRRQAVAAVLVRRTAERPQGILQSLGQGDEALAAEHHLGMLPAGERQPEVIQPMRQQHARDRYAKRIAIGEVRQALLSRWMFLAENQVTLGSVQRLPDPHPALQSAAR